MSYNRDMKKSKLDLELITRKLLKETNNNEDQMFKNIVKDNEKSRKEFEAYLDMWEKSADVRDFDKIDVNSDWSKIRDRMNFQQKLKKIPFRTNLIRIAAIVLLTLGLAYTINHFTKIIEPAADYFETASSNEKREVNLSDGTIISLNRNSKIIRNSDFGKSNRNIILEGEAFFNVAKNPKLPFKVYTHNSTIEVVGTSFNIKSDTIQVIVGVLTGKVAFYQTGNITNRLELMPEHTGFFQTESKSFKQESSLDVNLIAWHTGRLVFKNTPLSEVFEAIAGFFNKELFIEPGTPINSEILKYVEFDQQSLEEMIDIINLTLKNDKVDAEITESKLIVKKR
jgi:ferric-dicitrate binding protein FerR (iron transport regulator)